MEEPEINPHTYGYLIFDKQVKSALGKKAASSPVMLIKLDDEIQKNTNISTFIIPYPVLIKMDQRPDNITR